jgi:arsenate reductase
VTGKSFRVLFLSQRNSARSIMAEAILNAIGKGRFIAHSAGVRVTEGIDPIVLELLEHAQLPTASLRPKHYSEFTGAAASALDFVFTLSDTAAGEAPPVWPGMPLTAHWPSTDPTRYSPDDPERRLALIRVRGELERRLRIFTVLPFPSLDRLSLQQSVDEIGRGS